MISDTHGWLDEAVYEHFAACDEVWHVGDFGGVGLGLSHVEKAPPILPRGEGNGEDGEGEGGRGDRLEDGQGCALSYGDLFVQKFEKLFGKSILFY